MKKIIFVLFILLSSSFSLNAESDVKRIYEGSPDAKITILAFESLTCSHCANFHKDVYPELKKNFIDKGFVKLEYRNFPLDLAAFNAAKAAQCRTNNGEEILHFLYKNQNEWIKGNSIEELNGNLEKILASKNFESYRSV